MQPQIPQLPQEQPPAPLSTDQLIAEERSRVSSFKRAFTPRQEHRYLFDLFHHYRYPAIFGTLSLVMIITGGAFAFAKLGVMNPNKTNSDSTLVANDQSNSQAGTGAWSPDSGDYTDENSESEASGNTDSAGNDNPADSGDPTSDAADDTPETAGGESGGEPSPNAEEASGAPQEDPTEEGDDAGIAPVDTTPVTTPPPATQPTTPTPSAPSPVLAHKFTTISWNSNPDNTKVVADQVLSFAANSQIVGLQSLHNLTQRNAVKSKLICSTCKYAGYIPPYTDSKATQSSYPIIWNKSSFAQIGSGAYRKMSDSITVGTTYYSTRYATWVRLQSKVNGKQIFVVNTHLISGVESGGKATTNTGQISRYKTHMTNLVTLLKELKAANIPIYVTGSFSVNFRYDRYAYTSFFPYATLKPLGIRSEWDLMNLSGIASTAGTHETGTRIVDYVFTWERGDVASNAIAIASSNYGSTYKPVFYTTTIK